MFIHGVEMVAEEVIATFHNVVVDRDILLLAEFVGKFCNAVFWDDVIAVTMNH